MTTASLIRAVRTDTTAIRTAGLSKSYGRTLALDGLDLSVERGEVYGYLGPNGAGKTTTIRLLRPSAGRAELFGVDAWPEPVEAHRRVAYVAAEPNLWPALTGAETLEFLARVRGGADAGYREQLIERFQLDTSKKVRVLSHGNRQKVQLIAALASRAELLILDEPTGGLGPLMEMAFRETVREAKQRGQTVFLSSHILSEVEAVCDRVGILRAGAPGRPRNARRVAPVGADYRVRHDEPPSSDHGACARVCGSRPVIAARRLRQGVEGSRLARRCVRLRLRRELVLVDQPAEQVTTPQAIELDHVGEWLLVSERRPLPERPVRPMLVEMPDIRDEHVLEVTATEDQQPVEALPANASDPALGVRSRLRRPYRRFDHPDALGAEDLVKVAGESHEGGPPRRADSARRDKAL
jgi:ABC-type uncharacterized transport system ATPase subunit